MKGRLYELPLNMNHIITGAALNCEKLHHYLWHYLGHFDSNYVCN